ncbi:dnaJ homolog subfamily C member 5-like [Impatiens glandulifera]|uniref:dnaJ homolog subfamily C member 5-like n=1 Tax=Impatiens glandulifera TaxID=253017 RepID=UPI001FB0E93E|nr:dnaJ homolog subfamily C member 5-like [Impatiens glandulifera]
MHDPSNGVEAERLLAVAHRLLHAQNFNECRDFAVLAQENDPLLDGTDQILAVADVLMASQTKINNNITDWYAILQVNRRSDDLDLIKRQYRRLALLLHPDKNKFPFAESAFRLISDAWKIISDPSNKSIYDNEINETKKTTTMKTFWTVCPYCYNLYEYPNIYLDCCFKCQKCEKAFHGVVISPLPPIVPGKDAYYCYKAFFPIFSDLNQGLKKDSTVPVPVSVSVPPQSESEKKVAPPATDVSTTTTAVHTKKRGRPRKNIQS